MQILYLVPRANHFSVRHLALQDGGPLQDEGAAKRSRPDVFLLPDVLQHCRPLKQQHKESR